MSERKLYSVRLLASTTGSRRRCVIFRGGELRFNVGQKDPAAKDFPEKLLWLDSDSEVEQLKALTDFEVRISRKEVERREPRPESQKATPRAIGAKPADTTLTKEA